MRTLLALAIVLGAAAPAAADVWLVGYPPPEPAPEKPYVRPLLGDRWTVTAMPGVGWMQIDGTLGGGMLIDPTITHTYDRLEVSADYMALDWNDQSNMRSDGTLHRIGADVRYQFGRVRIERKMTMDAVATAGFGFQHITQDHGAPINRTDSSLGLVLRMLTDIDDRDKERTFFGMEIGVRYLRSNGGHDHGVVVAFGVPIGW